MSCLADLDHGVGIDHTDHTYHTDLADHLSERKETLGPKAPCLPHCSGM